MDRKFKGSGGRFQGLRFKDSVFLISSESRGGSRASMSFSQHGKKVV